MTKKDKQIKDLRKERKNLRKRSKALINLINKITKASLAVMLDNEKMRHALRDIREMLEEDQQKQTPWDWEVTDDKAGYE